MLRENLHEDVIFRWFLLIMMGKNPKIIEHGSYVKTGGLWVVPDDEDARVPDGNRRDMAMRELLNRRDGLPAQKIQIDAELRSMQLTGTLGPDAFQALAPDVLARVVGSLKGAIASPGAGGARALAAGPDEDDEDDRDESGIVDAEIVDETAAVIRDGLPSGEDVAA